MTATPLEQFADLLDRERAWRKKELSELVLALSTAGSGTQLETTLARALAILLNAHWEGLVRTSLDAYLNAARQMGKTEGLAESVAFRALALEATLKDAQKRESKRENGKLRTGEPASHPLVDVLLANEYEVGNLWDQLPNSVADRVGLSLWWDRLELLLGLVDVSLDRLAGDPTLINQRVVATRHKVAHGQPISVDPDEVLKARSRVVAITDGLIESLQDSLRTKRFAH